MNCGARSAARTSAGPAGCLAHLGFAEMHRIRQSLGADAEADLPGQVASAFPQLSRPLDRVGLDSSGHFLILLPHTTAEQARARLEAVGCEIASRTFQTRGRSIRLTATIGFLALRRRCVRRADPTPCRTVARVRRAAAGPHAHGIRSLAGTRRGRARTGPRGEVGSRSRPPADPVPAGGGRPAELGPALLRIPLAGFRRPRHQLLRLHRRGDRAGGDGILHLARGMGRAAPDRSARRTRFPVPSRHGDHRRLPAQRSRRPSSRRCRPFSGSSIPRRSRSSSPTTPRGRCRSRRIFTSWPPATNASFRCA